MWKLFVKSMDWERKVNIYIYIGGWTGFLLVKLPCIMGRASRAERIITASQPVVHGNFSDDQAAAG